MTPPPPGAGGEGHTLVEMLFGLALLSLLLALSAAALGGGASRATARAGARALGARLAALRTRAAAEGREVALLFAVGADEPFRDAADGNDDGLHRSDVDAGRDPAGPWTGLAAAADGARVGRPAWPSMADVPPGAGRLGPGDPAVRCGTSRMIVFDPEGHATPATVFVTDGTAAACAVVVAGATARVRTWCYDREADAWALL